MSNLNLYSGEVLDREGYRLFKLLPLENGCHGSPTHYLLLQTKADLIAAIPAGADGRAEQIKAILGVTHWKAYGSLCDEDIPGTTMVPLKGNCTAQGKPEPDYPLRRPRWLMNCAQRVYNILHCVMADYPC